MQEIKTIVQLRNDTATNWASEAGQATKLKPGEFAVEIGENGKAKIKIGTSEESTFGNSEYFGAETPKVFQNAEPLSVLNKEDDVDTVIPSLIPEGTELQRGDCAIVKRYLVAGDAEKVSYTSYVYDGSVWTAMDGNYSANNVYLKEDITLAGNYTRVGNLTKSSNAATSTFATAGVSIADALKKMLTATLQPTKTEPGANVKLKNGSSFTDDNIALEVGSKFTPNWSASLSAGSYTYGPATGIVAKTWEISDTDGNTAAAATGAFNEITVTDDTAYQITAKATYDAGAVATDNLGDESNPKVQIAAGSKSDSTGKVTGYRGWFYGYKNADNKIDVSALDSDKIRALTKANGSIPGTMTTDKMQQMFFAIPAGKKSTIGVANSTNGAPQTVTGPVTVYVKGANNYMTEAETANGGMAYDVWYVSNASAESGTTKFNITVS